MSEVKTAVDTDQGCAYGRRLQDRTIQLINGRDSVIQQIERYENIGGAASEIAELRRMEIAMSGRVNVATAALTLCDICNGDPAGVDAQDRLRNCPAALQIINIATIV